MQLTDLTLGDILNLQAVIDAASQRGVFKAVDMTPIGSLFEKLQKIAETLAPPAPEGADQPASE
jgi:hypothetical protein